MMAVNAAPPPPGAGPTGPESGGVRSDAGGGLDPLFQGEEKVERATPRATLLFQFFLFPLLIVVASVGVFLFFGAIGGGEKSPDQYLDAVLIGGENEQKQAAHQLGVALEKERRRVEEKKIPLAEAFYVKDGAFRSKLSRAFDLSFQDASPDRQEFLARAMGAVGDPAYAPVLKARLVPATAVTVRRGIVGALGSLQTEEVVPPLVAALKDSDQVVRNTAVQGLSRHPTPASLEGMKTALADEDPFVRMSAASGLALHGDASGRELVEHLLDPAWVQKNVVDAPSHQAGEEGKGPELRSDARLSALYNGIRAAAALKDPLLRNKVEALEKDEDPDVRRLARDVLDRWPSSK